MSQVAVPGGAYNVAVPVIAKLIPRRRNVWVEVVTEDGASIKLPRTALPAAVYADAKLDDDQWRELIALAEYHGLLDRALRILGRREHFERELMHKLRRHTADRELVARVLAECRRLEYLDDERAAQYASDLLVARGGIGPPRLRRELLRRGCPPELARRMVAEHGPDLNQGAEIARLLKAREKSTAARAARLRTKLAGKGLNGERLEYELRRQLAAVVQGYLAGRGFSAEHARRGAREFIDRLLTG